MTKKRKADTVDEPPASSRVEGAAAEERGVRRLERVLAAIRVLRRCSHPSQPCWAHARISAGQEDAAARARDGTSGDQRALTDARSGWPCACCGGLC